MLLSTFTVDTTSDVTDQADGHTTLREAVLSANSHSGYDVIGFQPGLSGTVGLTQGELIVGMKPGRS